MTRVQNRVTITTVCHKRALKVVWARKGIRREIWLRDSHKSLVFGRNCPTSANMEKMDVKQMMMMMMMMPCQDWISLSRYHSGHG